MPMKPHHKQNDPNSQQIAVKYSIQPGQTRWWAPLQPPLLFAPVSSNISSHICALYTPGEPAGNCLSRQQNTCPITGRMSNTYLLETAQLAHPIGNATLALYWRFLSLCFGTDLTSEIYDIISEPDVFSRDAIFFIPHVPNDQFHSATTCYYDVEFRWRASMAGLVGMNTELPQLPCDQVDQSLQFYQLMDTLRPISIGDSFRIYTRDPVRYPFHTHQ